MHCEQFTWFWKADLCRLYHSQCTDKTQHKHHEQKRNMRTDAFVLIARFFGGFKPSAASYSTITCWRVVFLHFFYSYKIPCNCMQIECSETSRVVSKTSRLQNNCNSLLKRLNYTPWCFIHLKAGQRAYAPRPGNVLSLSKTTFGAGVSGLTYPE